MPFPAVHPALDRALINKGYAEPTPVQAAVLEAEHADRDLLVSAQTGSGKTVAFGLAAAPTLLGFKRPYGWAWLLKLVHELAALPQMRWTEAMMPLAEIFAQRYRDFLPIAPYPVRVGTHFNTAFGLRMAADYAEGRGDAALLDLLRATALRWYGDDAIAHLIGLSEAHVVQVIMQALDLL